MENRLHSILAGILLFLVIAGLTLPWNKVFPSKNPWGMDLEVPRLNLEPDPDQEMKADHLARSGGIIHTHKGDMEFRFVSGYSEKTIRRVAQLIQAGFYNGLTFHRVVKTPIPFVVEGGDPNGDGTGGSGIKIPFEPNRIQVRKGNLCLSRAEDPDTADSVFFISLGVHPDLDFKYACFGKLIRGYEVADQLEPGDVMTEIELLYSPTGVSSEDQDSE